MLTDDVLAHFAQHRQRLASAAESGGQLFVRIDGSAVTIERATGPRPADHRSIFSYIPDRLAERREIARLFKEGLHCVGDWHTHPEAQPTPSGTDRRSIMDMFRRSKHQLAGFVMIIVGTDDSPAGLYIGVSDGKKLEQLSPS